MQRFVFTFFFVILCLGQGESYAQQNSEPPDAPTPAIAEQNERPAQKSNEETDKTKNQADNQSPTLVKVNGKEIPILSASDKIAKQANIWSMWQAIFGFGTLVLATFATWFAWGAYQAGRNAVRIGESTLAETKEASIQQLRAYVSLNLHRVSPINDGQVTQFVVEIKNVGSSPAKVIKVRLATLRSPKSWPNKIIFKPNSSRSISMIFPNDRTEIKTNLEITNGTIAGLKNETQIIHVAALIVYSDIFGIHRRTIAYWKADSINSDGGVTFHPAERGNQAS